jgi:thiol-disulfide isomerase/thioredoxin
MKSRLLVALVAVLAISSCTSSGGSNDFQFKYATKLDTLISPDSRKAAEHVDGKLLNGGTTSVQASKGKVLVLNFWASWCGPCQVETPQFEQVYQQLHRTGVDFLGIDTKDTRSGARTFLSENQISYPIVYDQQGETQLRLGDIPGVLPFTVLIDKKGRVAAVYLSKLTANDLTGPLHKLLAEH